MGRGAGDALMVSILSFEPSVFKGGNKSVRGVHEELAGTHVQLKHRDHSLVRVAVVQRC
mgnify:CR=1 FL=1